MIITTDFLLYSNACMTPADIEAARALGVIIGETELSVGIDKLQAAWQRALAAWLTCAGRRWRVKDEGAASIRYRAFNPVAGGYIDVPTEAEVRAARAGLVQQYPDTDPARFTMMKEFFLADGSSVNDPVI